MPICRSASGRTELSSMSTPEVALDVHDRGANSGMALYITA